MKRRSFIKNTIACTASVSFAGIFPGLFLKECNRRTITNQKIMKELIVKEIQHKGVVDLDLAEKLLERFAEFQFIETINWPEYPYKPEVKFKITFCHLEPNWYRDA